MNDNNNNDNRLQRLVSLLLHKRVIGWRLIFTKYNKTNNTRHRKILITTKLTLNDNIFFMFSMKVISFHGFTYIIVVIFKAGSMFIPSYLLEPAGPFNWYLGSPFTTYTLPPTHSNGGSFQPQ